MQISKIRRELGWAPRYSFESGLRQTIEWYLANDAWLAHVMDGSYKDYLRRQYGE